MKTGEESIGLMPAAGKGVRLALPYPKELYPVIRDNRYRPLPSTCWTTFCGGVRHCVFVVNDTKHQLIGYFGGGRRSAATSVTWFRNRWRRWRVHFAWIGPCAGRGLPSDTRQDRLLWMPDTIMQPAVFQRASLLGERRTMCSDTVPDRTAGEVRNGTYGGRRAGD